MRNIKKIFFKNLLALVSAGSVDALRAGLAENPELAKELDESGESLLTHALLLGQTDCALALAPLSKARRRDKFGDLPLILAAEKGQSACVAALLLLCSPVAPKDGLLALSRAALNGRVETVRILLDAHPEWALVANRSRETALLIALSFRQEACANLLLPFSDRSALAHGGESVLFRAAMAGFSQIVQQVLSPEGARKLTSHGWTPLMAAAKSSAAPEQTLKCVDSLLPLSNLRHRSRKTDRSLKTDWWFTNLSAEDIARNAGHELVANRIAIYEASLKERRELDGLAAQPQAPLRPRHRI